MGRRFRTWLGEALLTGAPGIPLGCWGIEKPSQEVSRGGRTGSGHQEEVVPTAG